MTLRKGKILHPRYRAVNGQVAGFLNGLPDDCRMTAAVYPAQDDTPDIHRGIKIPASQHHCRRCPCYFIAVDNQNNRCVEEFGEFGCAEFTIGIYPVEESPISFNERNRSLRGMA